MDEFIKKRGILKGKLTRLEKFLTNLDENTYKIEEIEVKLEMLDDAWKSFQEIHIQIILLTVDQADVDDHEDVNEEFENRYATMKTRFVQLIRKKQINIPCTSSAIPAIQVQTPQVGFMADVKLPKIDLPSFSGDYQDWTSFHDQFLASVHSNNKFSKSQKLNYLKSSLKGDASKLLRSLTITDANYDPAWDILQERYDNKRNIINAHLKTLFNLPLCNNESGFQLRKLLDSTVENVRALQVLGQQTDQWDAVLVSLLSSKMDTETRRQWELSFESTDLSTFQECTKFLTKRCNALEVIGTSKQKSSYTPNNGNWEDKSIHSVETDNSSNSLQTTHTLKENPHQQEKQTQVLLSTVSVKIIDSTGNFQLCRALLDDWSQATLISEACVQRLKLLRKKAKMSIQGISSSNAGNVFLGKVRIDLHSRISSFKIGADAFILQKLTRKLPNSAIKEMKWPHIQNLSLADPQFYQPSDIDILIGKDIHPYVMLDGKIKGEPGTPVAFNTEFGWTLGGPVTSYHSVNNDSLFSNHLSVNLDDQLQKFWSMEEISSSTPPQSQEEKEYEVHFQSTHTTHTRDTNRRFTVHLPFKKESLILGESGSSAVIRLKQLERRLSQNNYRKKHRWKTFVGKRVSEIPDTISPQHWNQVIAEENPADVASRGIFPQQLKKYTLWWGGPQWLREKSLEIENQEFSIDELKSKRAASIYGSSSFKANNDIVNVNHISRWQFMQHRSQQFWKKWQEEYLAQLQQHQKSGALDVS